MSRQPQKPEQRRNVEGHDEASQRPSASPPCYLAECDGQPLAGSELITWLNELLEGERAGARGLHELAKRHPPAIADLLRDVACDEGRFCVMLRRHILRLGGEPTTVTGVFYDKLLAKPALVDQLRLLDRGQSAVARSLEQHIDRIEDRALAGDLREMLDVHVVNIERCADPALLT